jgi:hypothetical protein
MFERCRHHASRESVDEVAWPDGLNSTIRAGSTRPAFLDTLSRR